MTDRFLAKTAKCAENTDCRPFGSLGGFLGGICALCEKNPGVNRAAAEWPFLCPGLTDWFLAKTAKCAKNTDCRPLALWEAFLGGLCGLCEKYPGSSRALGSLRADYCFSNVTVASVENLR